MTHQLLAFARRQIIAPRTLFIEDRIRSIEPLLRRVIGSHIRIEFSLDPKPHRVRIDPAQFDQLLMNLTLNAADAMPDGGTLRLETDSVHELTSGPSDPAVHVPTPRVRLRVSDTGRGMTPDVLADIFEPFFTTKEIGRGTGLGLATCTGIVERVGGSIQVQSVVDLGTTFEILLPGSDEPAAPDPTPARQLMRGGVETILIVEDDTQILELIGRVLRERCYTILSASSASTARAAMESHPGRVDLLLTDVLLPGTDGRKLAGRILEDHPEMAVLFMSGHSDEVLSRRGALEPGLHLLNKPFTPDALAERVRSVIDGHPQ